MRHRRLRPRATAPFRLAALAATLLLVLVGTTPARAAEAWTITSFSSDLTIRTDGVLDVQEAIDVDFGRQEKHGIFRDLSVRFSYDQENDRLYKVSVSSVTDGQRRSIPYETSTEGPTFRIKIGDPNRTVTGPQSYRLHYTLQGTLNAFPDHDELFWNVSGTWPVPILQWSTRVHGPDITQVACYQGPSGSRETCPGRVTGEGALFQSNRALSDGEQFTIVAGFPKGYVPEPKPLLTARERELPEYFLITPATVGGMLAAGLATIAGLGLLYWRRGRDLRYTTMYYLTEDPTEKRRGLLEHDQIVVEYQPPERMRPGQMGVLLDERADPRDMTATIVDLAVRGYLKITELPEQGFLWAKKKDWLIERQPRDPSDLLDYEKVLFNGLFNQRESVKVSDLRNHFYKTLAKARAKLYADVTRRQWFLGNPDTIRGRWVVYGVLTILVAAGLSAALGYLFGAALIGLPLVLAGIILIVVSGIMPRRSARGSEMLRRALGFREYIATAETDRQRFNEQANLFAEYLPYAMVFALVDRWVRAFAEADVQAAAASWYVGHGAFNASGFDREMHDFTSAAGTALASTPGSSGSSGFSSGGSSGGGGGGGGGGSW